MGTQRMRDLSRRRRSRIFRTVLTSVASIWVGSGAGPALAQVEAPDQTPSGMVAFFMMSGTACPSGWTAPPEVQGRLILGLTDPARVGQQVGSPLADQTPPGHDHTYTNVALTLSDRDLMLDDWCCNSDGAGQQTINLSGTAGSPSDASNLPFIQLVACRKD
jgi:hypothetical protein